MTYKVSKICLIGAMFFASCMEPASLGGRTAADGEEIRTANYDRTVRATTDDWAAWDGVVGKFRLEFLPNDLAVTELGKNNKVMLSSRVEIEVKKLATDILDLSPEYRSETLRVITSIRAKSVVGGLATFELSRTAIGLGTGSSQRCKWITIDFNQDSAMQMLFDSLADLISLERGKRDAEFATDLRDLWTDQEILAAIVENRSVKEFLTKEGSERPTSLQEFLESSSKIGFDSSLKGFLFIEVESMYGFAFDRIDDNRAIVRIPVFTQATRVSSLQSIEIELPMNHDLRKKLLNGTILPFGDENESNEHRNATIVIDSKL